MQPARARWRLLAVVARAAALAAALALTACAYVMPRTWRAYSASQPALEAAVRAALKNRGLDVIEFSPETATARTEWAVLELGASTYRERFELSWELEPDDGHWIVYVRHERQEQASDLTGPRSFGPSIHDADAEQAVLDEVTVRLTGAR